MAAKKGRGGSGAEAWIWMQKKKWRMHYWRMKIDDASPQSAPYRDGAVVARTTERISRSALSPLSSSLFHSWSVDATSARGDQFVLWSWGQLVPGKHMKLLHRFVRDSIVLPRVESSSHCGAWSDRRHSHRRGIHPTLAGYPSHPDSSGTTMGERRHRLAMSGRRD